MRVPRRPTIFSRIEAAERSTPSIAATPLVGGPAGPPGAEGAKGSEGKEGKIGPEGPIGPTSGGLILARAATTAALAANTLTGTVLEANANGALASQDGVALAVSDRLLVKNEGEGKKNGVYTVTSLGAAGSKWKLTRIASMDESAEAVGAMQFNVLQGTRNAATAWMLTTTGAIVLGTTALTFALVEKENPVNNTAGEDLKVIRGGIEVTATEAKILQGVGFTVARLGTGESKITFTSAFSGVPTVIPTGRSFAQKANCSEPLAATATIGTVNSAFAAANGTYDFVAIGPR